MNHSLFTGLRKRLISFLPYLLVTNLLPFLYGLALSIANRIRRQVLHPHFMRKGGLIKLALRKTRLTFIRPHKRNVFAVKRVFLSSSTPLLDIGKQRFLI